MPNWSSSDSGAKQQVVTVNEYSCMRSRSQNVRTHNRVDNVVPPANIARVEAIDAADRPKAEVAVLTLMDAGLYRSSR